MEILRDTNLDKLKTKFFDFFKSNLDVGFSSVALCGGRSIVSFLNTLNKKDLNLQQVHFFLSDERCVSLDDKDSNYKLLKDNFFSSMLNKNLLHSSNLHPFQYDEGDEYTSLYNYNLDFSSRFRNFNIVVLSAGEDGHIASLFPSSSLLLSNSNSYKYEYNSPKLPRKRMSLSPNMLMKSNSVILLFMGEGKRTAFNSFLGNNSSLNDCPAKLLKDHENLLVLSNIEE